MPSELIERLAAKAHDHRLVPFIGAGCSLGHVSVDWDGICQEMAGAINLGSGQRLSNPEVAEEYVKVHGNAGLAQLLGDRLLLRDFDDGRDTIPLQVLALELRALYTTNQDNVYELAAAKYGRPVRAIATIDDLAEVRPGDRVLYKFHGSLDHPDTLVFTDSQYKARLASTDFFMDVRLRSDLLTKNLLFIGYSFRDQNIKALFGEMAARFGSSLPNSFLLAYRWSADLDELCRRHGVECVNPSAHIQDPTGDPGLDLEIFLRELCERTFQLLTSAELATLITPAVPPPVRVAIRPQINALETIVASKPTGDALEAFRGMCDGVVIPEALRSRVAAILVAIIRRAAPDQASNISGALFNLRIPPQDLFEPVSAYLAFANRTPGEEPFNSHHPPDTAWPPALLPVVAARAVELLEEWGEPLSDNFYMRTPEWFDDHWSNLPQELKDQLRPIMRRAWMQRHTTYEEAVKRAERLAALPYGMSRFARTSTEIMQAMVASLPRRFSTPPED